MKIVRTVTEIKKLALEIKRSGKSIALVPTMGYLHKGHLSLIKKAREDCDILVVSIFVNPVQFGAGEDYKHYPRDMKRDEAMAAKEKADFIFAPNVSEMYPYEFSTFVDVEKLNSVMCGKSRPLHFRGVTTVVAKLFSLIQPDIAYFGQKDVQQTIIIKKMVSDLNMNVKIKVLPIVREKDGLAMSSRNAYLNEEERKSAAVLYKSLSEANLEIDKGERKARKIKKTIAKIIENEKPAKVDYIAIVNPENLQEIDTINTSVLIAIAVWIGKTRLIDNIAVNLENGKESGAGNTASVFD